MMEFLMCYLILINIIGFFIMLIDKYRAIMRKWRISENTLIGVSLLGGSVGMYAGMKVFGHKTLKPKFSIGIPMIFILQIAMCFSLFK